MTCITYYEKYILATRFGVIGNARTQGPKGLGTRISTIETAIPIRRLAPHLGQNIYFHKFKARFKGSRAAGQLREDNRKVVTGRRRFRAPKRIFSWRKYFYVSFNAPKMVQVWEGLPLAFFFCGKKVTRPT